MVTVDAAKTATATFVRTYALTVKLTGYGLINSNPAGMWCTSDAGVTTYCTARFDSASVLYLSGSQCPNFTYCPGTLVPGGCQVVMNADKTATVVSVGCPSKT